jgi:hemerythrin-like domain-containing protein
MTALTATFQDLEAYHRDLERLFGLHQEALVDRDFDLATKRLEQYEDALARHMRDEETTLIPMFWVRAGVVPGGSAETFRIEHDKIRQLLARIEQAMIVLMNAPGAAGIVAMIEREAHFKNLVEHHCLREHNVLFPTLDTLLAPDERKRMLESCAFRIEGVFEDLVAAPSRALSPLS